MTRRFLFALAVFLFTFSTHSAPAITPNPGIAFVHGTKDHRENAFGHYWKVEFIHTIAAGLANPENYYVVHCDFSRYMWHEDAAACVADQLLQFIQEKQLTSITVYTHSDGGNVVRWIISNPTYDSRYMAVKNKISQVIALAPSSEGTVLADEAIGGGVFKTSLAWILGYLTDAVKQQRIGDMLIYNDELLLGGKGRPSLPIPFKVVVGTDVAASPMTSSSYCNGYLLNAGLKITKLYLDDCADGFLSCNSQAAAGDVWFYDYEKTENKAPLSHNQSRHHCLGLEKMLISVLATKGVAP